MKAIVELRELARKVVRGVHGVPRGMAAIEVREHCGGAQEKGDQFTKF